MVADFKYIHDVPIGYSIYNNKITGIMGIKKKCYGLLNNIILQLITFYSYDDIKIAIFTNEQNKDKYHIVTYGIDNESDYMAEDILSFNLSDSLFNSFIICSKFIKSFVLLDFISSYNLFNSFL